MHEATRRLWNRGLNLTKWAQINGFKLRTVRAVLDGDRGKENIGISKKIRDALVDQGLMTATESTRETGK